MEHTPVPWKVVDRWKIVRDAGHPLPRLIVETTISGECEVYQGNADEANARFIVQAVNSHEALVEALRRVKRDCIDEYGERVRPKLDTMIEVDDALNLAGVKP